MDFDVLLADRIGIIRDIVSKYGEDNFYIAFSGGKDSTVLHYLVDLAIPNNRIPRVFVNTGIEYNEIREFVKNLSLNDSRFVIVNSGVRILQMLEKYGYPFKSKLHSHMLSIYQHSGMTKSVDLYLNSGKGIYSCPSCLKYQFSSDFSIKCNDICCKKLKKEPISKWCKEHNKSICISGMRKEEGGNRGKIDCALVKNGALKKFNPLAVVSTGFEMAFINKYKIKLCCLYYYPFMYSRTGCKGCPFSLGLKNELEKMREFFPNEYKQCLLIWGKVYSEYSTISFRLDSNFEKK